MKKLLLFIAALPIVFATSCLKDKEEDPIVTPTVAPFELDGYYKDLDDLVIKISGNTGVIVAFGTSDFGKDPAALNVGDECLRNLHKLDDKTYEGDRLKARYNMLTHEVVVEGWETVEIDRFGQEQDFSTTWFNGYSKTFSYIGKTYTGGGGTGGNQYNGIWVREMGRSGDETDLAIGNIPGQPANAVWMCEWEGQVGLYKGTISGNIITFDAQYGLPTYTVSKDGDKLMLQGNITGSLATPYSAGSWTSHCGTLGN